jgi:hypothetical protein
MMSIFFIGIIASKARLASAPPAASASVGIVCVLKLAKGLIDVARARNSRARVALRRIYPDGDAQEHFVRILSSS